MTSTEIHCRGCGYPALKLHDYHRCSCVRCHKEWPYDAEPDIIKHRAIEIYCAPCSYAFGVARALGVTETHVRTTCLGADCTFHRPSDHGMRTWPMVWRSDRRIVERTCPHGVGHPDPDSLDWMLMHGDDGTHGCDGCCLPS